MHAQHDGTQAGQPPPTRSQLDSAPERRVYRSSGSGGGNETVNGGDVPARGRRGRAGRRSRIPAVIVLVLVAIVIVLAGIAANTSALEGSQGVPDTFKLLPITTTTT